MKTVSITTLELLSQENRKELEERLSKGKPLFRMLLGEYLQDPHSLDHYPIIAKSVSRLALAPSHEGDTKEVVTQHDVINRYWLDRRNCDESFRTSESSWELFVALERCHRLPFDTGLLNDEIVIEFLDYHGLDAYLPRQSSHWRSHFFILNMLNMFIKEGRPHRSHEENALLEKCQLVRSSVKECYADLESLVGTQLFNSFKLFSLVELVHRAKCSQRDLGSQVVQHCARVASLDGFSRLAAGRPFAGAAEHVATVVKTTYGKLKEELHRSYRCHSVPYVSPADVVKWPAATPASDWPVLDLPSYVANTVHPSVTVYQFPRLPHADTLTSIQGISTSLSTLQESVNKSTAQDPSSVLVFSEGLVRCAKAVCRLSKEQWMVNDSELEALALQLGELATAIVDLTLGHTPGMGGYMALCWTLAATWKISLVHSSVGASLKHFRLNENSPGAFCKGYKGLANLLDPHSYALLCEVQKEFGDLSGCNTELLFDLPEMLTHVENRLWQVSLCKGEMRFVDLYFSGNTDIEQESVKAFGPFEKRINESGGYRIRIAYREQKIRSDFILYWKYASLPPLFRQLRLLSLITHGLTPAFTLEGGFNWRTLQIGKPVIQVPSNWTSEIRVVFSRFDDPEWVPPIDCYSTTFELYHSRGSVFHLFPHHLRCAVATDLRIRGMKIVPEDGFSAAACSLMLDRFRTDLKLFESPEEQFQFHKQLFCRDNFLEMHEERRRAVLLLQDAIEVYSIDFDKNSTVEGARPLAFLIQEFMRLAAFLPEDSLGREYAIKLHKTIEWVRFMKMDSPEVAQRLAYASVILHSLQHRSASAMVGELIKLERSCNAIYPSDEYLTVAERDHARRIVWNNAEWIQERIEPEPLRSVLLEEYGLRFNYERIVYSFPILSLVDRENRKVQLNVLTGSVYIDGEPTIPVPNDYASSPAFEACVKGLFYCLRRGNELWGEDAVGAFRITGERDLTIWRDMRSAARSQSPVWISHCPVDKDGNEQSPLSVSLPLSQKAFHLVQSTSEFHIVHHICERDNTREIVARYTLFNGPNNEHVYCGFDTLRVSECNFELRKAQALSFINSFDEQATVWVNLREGKQKLLFSRFYWDDRPLVFSNNNGSWVLEGHCGQIMIARTQEVHGPSGFNRILVLDDKRKDRRIALVGDGDHLGRINCVPLEVEAGRLKPKGHEGIALLAYLYYAYALDSTDMAEAMTHLRSLISEELLEDDARGSVSRMIAASGRECQHAAVKLLASWVLWKDTLNREAMLPKRSMSIEKAHLASLERAFKQQVREYWPTYRAGKDTLPPGLHLTHFLTPNELSVISEKLSD